MARMIGWFDRFLSPPLRTMESRDLLRARFLAFSILFAIPCNFVPCLLHIYHQGRYSAWIYESLLNVIICMGLLWHLRRATSYFLATRIFLLWVHSLIIFLLWSQPAIFSLAYLWSPCLIVLSSLIFGMQGAILSSILLSGSWIFNLLWQFQNATRWVASTDADAFTEQLLLHIMGSSLFMALVMGTYEFLRESSSNIQARQRLLAARHAHTGAVGELVGHVAHEVNNPLAILQGSLARLRRHLDRNEWTPESRRMLAYMQNSHERIIKVQQGLAVFSSGNQHEPFVTCDIRTIFKDVQMAMKPPAQVQRVQLDFVDRSGNAAVRCQRHQITYVLCSLIQNALDALRDQPAPRIVVEVKYDARIIAMQVSDNGRGIEASVQERIFQPFFTTKTGGAAQGLSLSVSRGILAEHGGAIEFSSQPGATTFTLQWPGDSAPSSKLRKGA